MNNFFLKKIIGPCRSATVGRVNNLVRCICGTISSGRFGTGSI